MMRHKERCQQCVFVRKMTVQCCRTNVGPPGDRIHRHLNAFLHESATGDVQNVGLIGLCILASPPGGKRQVHNNLS